MKEIYTYNLDRFFEEFKKTKCKLEIIITNGKLKMFGMGDTMITFQSDLEKVDFKIHNMIFIYKERYAIHMLEVLYK